jgi:Sortase domain
VVDSRLLRIGIAGGLAVVGVLLLWAALPRTLVPADPGLAAGREEHGVLSPSPAGSRSAAGRRDVRADQRDLVDRITGSVLPESDPVSVAIPGIGVRTGLVELGLEADGTMEVPGDPAKAGWFRRAAAPGALGPAVIAGHVTWDGAPGVFHRLGKLRPGDRVAVTRKDGRIAVFNVTRLARYSKSRFPSRSVYGAIDHAGLRLITCGGTYDAAENRYLDNVVVFARLEAVRRSGR